VAQSVDGDATTFAWDWASGVPELLRQGKTRYLVGHDTLGWHDGNTWTYSLPDALGSVRQTVDAAGAVVNAREWTPFGVAVGESTAGLGYTGEWWDADVGLEYLRARWYQPGTGRFTQVDPQIGIPYQPHTMVQEYAYGRENPLTWVDPSGMIEQWWEDMLRNPHWRSVFFDSAKRHNQQHITNLDDQSFASVMASIVLIEGGNIGGASGGLKGKIGEFVGPLPEDIRIPLVSTVKWGEILCNVIVREILAKFLEHPPKYQTEGLSNINPHVIDEARQYGIDIYKFPLVQFNVEDPYHRPDGSFDRSQYWQGQEQWVEYLAASFEVVQKRAQELGVDISKNNNEDGWAESIRAFAQWHDRGIVEAFGVEGNWYDEEELAIDPDDAWGTKQIAAQDSATRYYQRVTSHWRAALTGLTE
ncbi:MAG: RHS repeat-associated core domain-containing protein, partial [Anaerolineae bacterium]|nr:RHS repeat-associated core domain-containing protein [Anaerolineae bacterium]